MGTSRTPNPYRSPTSLMSRFAAPDDNLATIHDVWESSIGRYRAYDFLGWRESQPDGSLGGYKWMTYGEAGRVRDDLASGLLSLGLAPGSTVGIYSVNCPEWVLADAACHCMSMVSVPLYDTLGPDAVRYICGHAELSAVVCSAKVLPIVLQVAVESPSLRAIIVFGMGPGNPLPPAPRGGLRILLWQEVLDRGRSNPRRHVPPAADQMATICYTSGTTGVPKGAVLSHANIVANAAGSSVYFPVGPSLSPLHQGGNESRPDALGLHLLLTWLAWLAADRPR